MTSLVAMNGATEFTRYRNLKITLLTTRLQCRHRARRDLRVTSGHLGARQTTTTKKVKSNAPQRTRTPAPSEHPNAHLRRRVRTNAAVLGNSGVDVRAGGDRLRVLSAVVRGPVAVDPGPHAALDGDATSRRERITRARCTQWSCGSNAEIRFHRRCQVSR